MKPALAHGHSIACTWTCTGTRPTSRPTLKLVHEHVCAGHKSFPKALIRGVSRARAGLDFLRRSTTWMIFFLEPPQPIRSSHFTVPTMDVVFVLFTAWIGIRGSDARASVIDCISVTTPRQLQESVSTGVTHVVVNDHIDISNLPSLSGSLGQGAEVLTIQRNSNGRYTKSIVVRCSFTRHPVFNPCDAL